MEEKIIIAGFGGQGVLFLGKIICGSGILMGYNVTYFPSYGAEVRGGTAHCHVVLSDKNIASPVIDKATAIFVMNQPSLTKFGKLLCKGGLLLYNSTLVKKIHDTEDKEIVAVPATDLAYKSGDVKIANMVMLGRYISSRNMLSRESVTKNLKGPLAGLNTRAFDKGYYYQND